MLQSDFLDNGKSQSGAASFGGEEGHKDFVQTARRNARAIVAHGHKLPVATAMSLLSAADRDLAGMAVRGGRFRRIAREIEQRLAQQAGVTGNLGKASFGANGNASSAPRISSATCSTTSLSATSSWLNSSG